MRNTILGLLLMVSSMVVFGQSETKAQIKLISEFSSDNREIKDLFEFEGIQYLKLSFESSELADKSYKLSVKEIWDGKIKNEEDVINSAKFPFEQFQKVNDTVLNIGIISKRINNKLKMTFKLPNFSISKEFDAIASDDYSLRTVAALMNKKIEIGKKFYLLAYMLPYEKGTYKYYCAVESSGKPIENWGKEFGIKHYLVFEMMFQQLF